MDADGRKTFGFVRNPWDWVVSVYAYNSKRPISPLEFRRWLIDGNLMLGDDFKDRGIPPMQRRSQMYWLEGCDRIGRFENLAGDFASICKEFGITAEPLGHLNGSEPRDYREFHSQETVGFVGRFFKPEIRRFGYAFGC